jgi:hypothetical protein
MHDPEPGVGRRVLARYSPFRVLLFAVGTGAWALSLWSMMTETGQFEWFTHRWREELPQLFGVVALAWALWVCGLAAWRILLKQGSAVWALDGLIFYGLAARGLEISRLRTACRSTGRWGWVEIDLNLDKGSRTINTALLAGGQGAVLREIWALKLGLEAQSAQTYPGRV